MSFIYVSHISPTFHCTNKRYQRDLTPFRRKGERTDHYLSFPVFRVFRILVWVFRILKAIPFPCLILLDVDNIFSYRQDITHWSGQVRCGGHTPSLHPPCGGTPSAPVWPSPRRTPGPSYPYPTGRTSPDATMKRVDALRAWSSRSDLDQKESDGRDPPQGVAPHALQRLILLIKLFRLWRKPCLLWITPTKWPICEWSGERAVQICRRIPHFVASAAHRRCSPVSRAWTLWPPD